MLAPWKKSYDQPRQHIKKQKHSFAKKGPSMVFLVVMYGCESWTIKKAERRRIDAFELWCWKRLLRVPWTASRSNQSILKEINPDCSLEGLMLNCSRNALVTWCEELTHWERPWCWERLKARVEGDDRGWYGWMADSMDMSLSKLRELVMDREAWRAAAYAVAKRRTRLSDWTELNWTELNNHNFYWQFFLNWYAS